MAAMKEALLGQEERLGNNPQDCTTSSVAEAVRMTCHSLGIDHDVADTVVGGVIARLRTAVTFQDVEALVSSVLPWSHFGREVSVYPTYSYMPGAHPTSLAEAEEAAAAIIAQYGGSVTVRHYEDVSKCWAIGSVRIETHGIDVTIFFDHEEVPVNAS